MQIDIDIRVSPKEAANLEIVKRIAADQANLSITKVLAMDIIKRSIDARQRSILINLKVRLFTELSDVKSPVFNSIIYPDVSQKKSALIIGAGPAGIFAALRLIELGIRPILIERGKNVRDRKRDIAIMNRTQVVNPDSNYCFGEGGAGSYSDGKLYTRSKKRGNVDKILHVFCQHGADPNILVDAHPHIGTDKLPAIIEAMRNQIISSGGEVHFETKMESLIIKDNEVQGITTSNGNSFYGSVILATGHSARDVYYMLNRQQVKMEAKGLAIGVRVEHPAHLIDQLQYHQQEGRGSYLPAAEYSFIVQQNGRGVYSFCMCPGGIIVASASGDRQVVVNGMSPSNRGSRWSNSGIVVEIHPEDFPEYSKYNELALLQLQSDIEELAWINGGRSQVAPAQLLTDFVEGRSSTSLPATSYAPGIVESDLHLWLPVFISSRLREAFKAIDHKKKGFLTAEAIVLGVETRTSSPVRILRSKDTLEHIELKNLYPCGEGAGYAGGIVSAAMDGERCAESLAFQFK